MRAFPNIDQAHDWYMATKDGLGSLEAYVYKGTARTIVSDRTLDKIHGMTEQDWRSYYERNLDKHELFSSLALFAACEGGIRRDFEWRISGDNGQEHYQRFQKLTNNKTPDRIALATILDNWQAAEKRNKWSHRPLLQLQTLFTDRNDLAHGRIGAAVAFDPVYEKLKLIRDKWRAGVRDFHGY